MGLRADDAAARLLRDGPNLLPVPHGVPSWRRFGRQLVHFFALLLWAAAGMAVLAGMPELGVAIAVVIVVNAVFAFAQEHRAERAGARLRDLLPRYASVLRDGGVHRVDAADLVVGDLVLLAAGDRVCADLDVVTAAGLTIDSSTLTGESVPLPIAPGDVAHAGTFVVGGDGRGRVRATGGATRMASIAALTQEGERPPSPLTIELNRVVRAVATVAIGVGVAFFLISVVVGTSTTDGFLFAVGVTVALVPEGLLPTVTLSLAMGAQRMAKRHALVRRLDAVETLGSTTFICTDKTGTLTQNEMTVVAVWTPGAASTVRLQPSGFDPSLPVPRPSPSVVELARAASLCSDGHVALRQERWTAVGDPMEAALDVLARRTGVAGEFDPARRFVARFPFDPEPAELAARAGCRGPPCPRRRLPPVGRRAGLGRRGGARPAPPGPGRLRGSPPPGCRDGDRRMPGRRHRRRHDHRRPPRHRRGGGTGGGTPPARSARPRGTGTAGG